MLGSNVKEFRLLYPDIPLMGDPPYVPAALFRNSKNDIRWTEIFETSSAFLVGERYDLLQFVFNPQNPIDSLQAIMGVLERRNHEHQIPFLMLKAIELFPDKTIPWIRTNHADLAEWFSNPRTEYPRVLKKDQTNNQWWAKLATRITRYTGWQTWMNNVPLEDYKRFLSNALTELLQPQNVSIIYRLEEYPEMIKKPELFPNGEWWKECILNVYKNMSDELKNKHAHAILIFGDITHTKLPLFEEFCNIVHTKFVPDITLHNPLEMHIHPSFRDDWLNLEFYKPFLKTFLKTIETQPDYLFSITESDALLDNYYLSAHVLLQKIVQDPKNKKSSNELTHSLYTQIKEFATDKQWAQINMHLAYWISTRDKTAFVLEKLMSADIAWAAETIENKNKTYIQMMKNVDPKWLVWDDLETIFMAQVFQQLDPNITCTTVTMLISKHETMLSLDPEWTWTKTLESWMKPIYTQPLDLENTLDW